MKPFSEITFKVQSDSGTLAVVKCFAFRSKTMTEADVLKALSRSGGLTSIITSSKF